MLNDAEIFKEVKDLYKIIPLNVFRRTPGVYFDNVPTKALPRIDAIDRVIHEQKAISPGPVGEVERPWYMHPCQDDNLVVLHGTRLVDIYRKQHGKMESFVVTANQISKNGQIIYDGPAMLVWPRGVFHRIESLAEGSSAINFAVHYPGIDMQTNFNIYDLDLKTGQFRVIRAGHQDQK
ncbi:MAG: hypothetical protein KKB30_00105 [Proteobacteria bacterium]|nr:hypothetical protein [Pseudomonadota bacterium]MBU1716557.1 hypothetical protein [Pseudomonadota bacterium]